VNSGEPQRRFLNFTNINPVSVTILAFRTNISGITIQETFFVNKKKLRLVFLKGLSISLEKIVGPSGETVNKNRSKKTASPQPANSGIFTILEPRHSAIVKFDLVPAKYVFQHRSLSLSLSQLAIREGKFDGTVQLETSYENKTLSLSYRSLEGKPASPFG